ncbi:MAG: 50S ribosomal protein L11 methyltransferase [Elusimicrobia bacterium]|nr:50S ribosomal protein L11 methyltransferase [Elusimicrobiota bacterium]
MLARLARMNLSGLRVLDVGTGPASLAICAVARGGQATAIDIDPVAIAAAGCNAAIAGVESRLSLRQTPIQDFDSNGRFDLILFNPPFLPVLPGGSAPLVAGGGPDGFAIIRHLTAKLPRLLADEGMALILCRLETSSRGQVARRDVEAALSLAPGRFKIAFEDHDVRPLVEDIFLLAQRQYPGGGGCEVVSSVLADPSLTGRWAHYGILGLAV